MWGVREWGNICLSICIEGAESDKLEQVVIDSRNKATLYQNAEKMGVLNNRERTKGFAGPAKLRQHRGVAQVGGDLSLRGAVGSRENDPHK